MSDHRTEPLSELLTDHTLMEAAIQRGVREAVITHAKLGQPVCTLRDGKVVWIPPEEILAQFATHQTANGSANGHVK
jgi:hypothetical protein